MPVRLRRSGHAASRGRPGSKDRALQHAAVSRLSRLALAGADEAEMLDEAVRAVAEALHVEMAKYLELAPGHDVFVLRAAVGWPEGLVGVGHRPGRRAPVLRGLRRRRRTARAGPGPPHRDPVHPVPPIDRARGRERGQRRRARAQGPGPRACSAGNRGPSGTSPTTTATLLQTIANVVSVGVLRRRSEERFRKLVQNSSDLITIVDDKMRAGLRQPGGGAHARLRPGRTSASKCSRSSIPTTSEATAGAFFDEVLGPGLDHPVIFRFRADSGEWRVLEVVATNCLDDPAVGGVVVNGRDVTERTNLTRALRTLAKSNQVLVNASDEAALLSGACNTIVEAGNYRLAWVGYAEHDEARTVRPVAWAGQSGYLQGITVSWADDEHGHGATGTAVRDRQRPGDRRHEQRRGLWPVAGGGGRVRPPVELRPASRGEGRGHRGAGDLRRRTQCLRAPRGRFAERAGRRPGLRHRPAP